MSIHPMHHRYNFRHARVRPGTHRKGQRKATEIEDTQRVAVQAPYLGSENRVVLFLQSHSRRI